jgi:hypothetical protein
VDLGLLPANIPVPHLGSSAVPGWLTVWAFD